MFPVLNLLLLFLRLHEALQALESLLEDVLLSYAFYTDTEMIPIVALLLYLLLLFPHLLLNRFVNLFTNHVFNHVPPVFCV